MIEAEDSNTVMAFGAYFQVAFQRPDRFYPASGQFLGAQPGPALCFWSFLTRFPASWALTVRSHCCYSVCVNLVCLVLLASLDLGYILVLFLC